MDMRWLLAVCVLLGTAAQGLGAGEVTEQSLAGPKWEIGPEVSYFQYEEPGTMKDTGVLYGVAGAYTRYHENRLFRIEGEFCFGLVDYEGTLDDGTPYAMENCRDYLLNLRLLWGRPWETGDWDSRLYAGLGYRALNDDSSHDPLGYDRQSNYLYLPVGLKTYHELADHWQIGLGGELDVLLLGIQFSGIYEDGVLTNVQWPGFGARASVELRHRAESADLALAPFVQYWWVDDSNVSDGWYEPRNNTLQYGLGLIWRF
ncbi:MAG: hypothetical protein NTZ17_06105 [Phycisphaerae bacterium]|nr:hypothetical protein [Phycisphaerae bacterium]